MRVIGIVYEELKQASHTEHTVEEVEAVEVEKVVKKKTTSKEK